MEKQITIQQNFSAEQINVIKEQIAKGATDSELQLFLQVAKKTGLDPFTRQIYCMKRWDGKQKKEVLQIGTSIDGFRLIAERSGEYEGQDGPYWCGQDGTWVDVWLSEIPPLAAKVGCFKKGFRQVLYTIALWEEYAQHYFDKEKQQWVLSPMWKKMPALMLAKTAEALCLRKAFPNDLSGLYTADEYNPEAKVKKEVRNVMPKIDTEKQTKQSEYQKIIEWYSGKGIINLAKKKVATDLFTTYGVAKVSDLTIEQIQEMHNACLTKWEAENYTNVSQELELDDIPENQMHNDPA